ncbi:uncharacterized protein LOC136083101 [Hydra vulgaris]
MDNLQKPIPRFIHLNGYEVRAIYNGQEDAGRPHKNCTTNQQNEQYDCNKPTSNSPLDTTLMLIKNENHVKITESMDKLNDVKEYKEKTQAQPLETAIESQLKTTLESIIMNENDSIKTNENKKVANIDNKQDSKKEDSVKNVKGDDDNSNDEYDSSEDSDSRDDDDSSGDDGSYDDDSDEDSSEEECEVP